jgi:hypothetical protein
MATIRLIRKRQKSAHHAPFFYEIRQKGSRAGFQLPESAWLVSVLHQRAGKTRWREGQRKLPSWLTAADRAGIFVPRPGV